MGSIPHPKEVCEQPNSHAERKLRDRWDAAQRLFSTGGVGDILCEIAAKEFHLPPSHSRVQVLAHAMISATSPINNNIPQHCRPSHRRPTAGWARGRVAAAGRTEAGLG
eukprot:scaffold1071_cov113-Isochrysis_galbana.AAC.3